MGDYNFEIKRGERVLYSIEGVSLLEPDEAWGLIEDLARKFDAEGLRIVVKDETGNIVIMAGLVSARPSPAKSAA
jgi:hypothetical protein